MLVNSLGCLLCSNSCVIKTVSVNLRLVFVDNGLKYCLQNSRILIILGVHGEKLILVSAIFIKVIAS